MVGHVDRRRGAGQHRYQRNARCQGAVLGDGHLVALLTGGEDPVLVTIHPGNGVVRRGGDKCRIDVEYEGSQLTRREQAAHREHLSGHAAGIGMQGDESRRGEEAAGDGDRGPVRDLGIEQGRRRPEGWEQTDRDDHRSGIASWGGRHRIDQRVGSLI